MNDIHQQFLDNLERAAQISKVPATIIDLAQASIDSLGAQRNRFGGDAAANQRRTIQRIKDSPTLKEILPIVYGQEIVLFISSFEAFLNELTRHIGNEHIIALNWPDNSSGKIDLADLKRNSVTIGDLVLSILTQRGVNFQDLQSIKRFFKEYLNTEIVADMEYEQNIILATAIRHVVVHAAGVATPKFLQQIRTLDTSVRSSYQEGAPIEITELDIESIRASLIAYAENIRDAVNTQIRTR